VPSKSIDELEEIIGETHRTVENFAVEREKVAEFARAPSATRRISTSTRRPL